MSVVDMATEEGYVSVKKYNKMADRLCDVEKYARGWQDSVKKGNIQIENNRKYIKVEKSTINEKTKEKEKKKTENNQNKNDTRQISMWI